MTDRILIIESGDEWRAIALPTDWDLDDTDRYLNGMAYGRAAVVPVETMADDGGDRRRAREHPLRHRRDDPDSFLPVDGGEYGGGSM